MGDYKITRRGMLMLIILIVLATYSVIKGSIYLAVFSFWFCSVLLLITLYEVFINK